MGALSLLWALFLLLLLHLWALVININSKAFVAIIIVGTLFHEKNLFHAWLFIPGVGPTT